MKLAQIIEAVGKLTPKAVGPDGFPALVEDPLGQAQAQLGAYLREAAGVDGPVDPSELEGAEALLGAEGGRRGELVCACLMRLGWIVGQTYYLRAEHTQAVVALLERLVRRPPRLEAAALGRALEVLGQLEHTCGQELPWGPLLRALEEHLAHQGLGQAVATGLLALQDGALLRDQSDEIRARRGRLEKMLANCHEAHVELGEPWADALQSDLEALKPEQRAAWEALLEHVPLRQNRPSKRWRDAAAELLEEVGEGAARAALMRWLSRVGQRPSMSVQGRPASAPEATIPSERNEELLRGFVWAASLIVDETLGAALGDLALSCYTKLPGIGPRCARLGNACIWALGASGQLSALGQLWRLEQRIGYASAQRIIARTVEEAATAHQLDVRDLEELSVPTFGLDAAGQLRREIGDWRVELELDPGGRAPLSWRWVRPRVNGQVQLLAMFEDLEERAHPPQRLRQDHPAELAEIEATRREIDKMLQAQRDRLEGLYLSQRHWPLAQWRQRYLDHPLMAPLTRRLIWLIEELDGTRHAVLWHQGALRGADGAPLEVEGLGSCAVTLWHPLQAGAHEREAWKRWLLGHQLTQPFKQAHRELYTFQGADPFAHELERRVLRQHQLVALCRERGWSARLQGTWEPPAPPSRQVPGAAHVAQLWVEPLADRALTTQAGAHTYVLPRQVRLVDEQGLPVAWEEVEPVVFSELMRQVDLFMSVACVSPEQADEVLREALERRGLPAPQPAPMSQAARVRGEVLEGLLDHLDWGGPCQVTERALCVARGERRWEVDLDTGLVRARGERLIDADALRDPRRGQPLPAPPFEGDGLLHTILRRARALATCQPEQLARAS